jgi:outer membrane protein assembly factor BamB
MNTTHRRYWRVAALVLLVAAAGCSRNKVKPDKPLPLIGINTTLKVESRWSAGIKDELKLRLGLNAAVEGANVYLAGAKGDVEALQAASGKSLWKRDLRAPLAGGPGAGGDLVVVGSSKGAVFALNAKDGTQRWRVSVGAEVLTAPAVNMDVVVVRTSDGKLHGLSATDGKQLWLADQQMPRLTLRGAAPPVISGDLVVAGFDNGRLLALTLTAGTVVWDTAISQARGSSELARLVDIDSPVAVDGDDLFVVGYQGRVARVARGTGEIIWAKDISSYRGLAIDSEGVYISTAAGEIVKLERSSGVEVWRQTSLLRRQLSGPAVIGTHVVVADIDGVVHWLNADDGRFVARQKVGDRVSGSPLVAGELLLVRSDKGALRAFRAPG